MSSYPEKQDFSAGLDAGSVTVTEATDAGDSKDDRCRCVSVRVVNDRDFELAGFKWLEDKSFEDTDDLPNSENLLVSPAISNA